MISPPPLTPDEKHILLDKRTEPPFSGKYNNMTSQGIYLCRQCGAPLYRAYDKFSSECGWPSFDDEIPRRVKHLPDSDGRRTEIVCANCGGHLGHVFEGEMLTFKNKRHCVNSLSLLFLPFQKLKEYALSHLKEFDIAYVAGGCFWGIEERVGNLPGVLATQVGYTGGKTDQPTYRDVCSHATGHAEAVEVILSLELLSLSQLYQFFFRIHDPSQLNRQGPDIGDQYRSTIFYRTDLQKQIAEKEIEKLLSAGSVVVTTLEELKMFWPAEQMHQHYFKN